MNGAGEALKLFSEHGLPGLVIVVLFACVAFMLWLHYKERREWREEFREEREAALKTLTGSMDRSSQAVERGSDSVARVVDQLKTIILTQRAPK